MNLQAVIHMPAELPVKDAGPTEAKGHLHMQTQGMYLIVM